MAKGKPQINLNSADKIRDKITARQVKQIQNMFSKLAKEAREKAKKLSKKDNISSIIQKKYLEDLAKELEHQMKADFANLKKNIEKDMTQVSESVIDCIKEFEESVGMPISNSWLNITVDAVEAVQSGKLYAGNWTLSSRIWGIENKVKKDIHTVIAEGIAANKSAYDIAKDLEKYVDPKAKKDWEWSKVYPGTNRKIDYSAQRLARTMVSHAYQFSFVESTKDNPFITKYKWISSHDKRVCEICKDRDGKLFDKDKLPLDHPNGRCTFVPVFDKSMNQIGDELAKWVKSPEGTFPGLDVYMKKRFGTDRFEKAMQMAGNIGGKEDKVSKHKTVNGNPNAMDEWRRREGEFKFAIEDIINYQGFDGLPNIVGSNEFDELVKKSNFIAQRTYSAPSKDILDSYREQLYNGKWYVDCSAGGSAYGQGMYGVYENGTSITEEMKREIRAYKRDKETFIETFTLAEDARTVKMSELPDLVIQKRKELLDYVKKSGWSQESIDKVADADEALSDYGQFAALLGYDAIIVDTLDKYVVVLNRTKLIIKGE